MKTEKKDLHQQWNFFFPRIQVRTCRSDAHQRQIIVGDTDVDHTQIIGEDAVKIFGGYIPPSPPGFGTPAQGQGSRIQKQVFSKNKTKKNSSKNFFQAIYKKAKKSPSKFSTKFLAFSNQVLTFQRV